MKEELLFGSTRTEYDTSVSPYTNATDAVKTPLNFIVYRPRAALTHALRRHYYFDPLNSHSGWPMAHAQVGTTR